MRVRLTPNSSCCKVLGYFAGADGLDWLKVAVISVPEKGKANKELIAYLAKSLKIAKAKVEIISGELDRYKKILIKEDKAIIEKWLGEMKDDSIDY